jgi:arginine/lysine/ornithine decarboxylase
VAALRAEVARRALPMHMPGHRNGPGAPADALAVLGAAAFAADRSEIGGFPYLHAPDGALREALGLAARCFGAARTWFLVNGSTVGNQAALMACAGPGDLVLVPRASHRSVHAALALSGATPLWVPNRWDAQHRGWFEPDVDAARRAAARAGGPVAVVHLTRPTYYGVAAPLAPWRALADDLGAVLVVDEAHGSHLVLGGDGWPEPALSGGADLVVQSTHKTLGALTQASMLHLGPAATGARPRGHRHPRQVDPDRVAAVLALLQSSSPSTLLLASLDAARAHVHGSGPELRHRLDRLVRVARAALEEVPGVVPWARRADLDPTKLVLDVGAGGRRGTDVGRALAAAGVHAELVDTDRVVCSLTAGDDEATVVRLTAAVRAAVEATAPQPLTAPLHLPPEPRAVMPIGEAIRRPTVAVPFAAAAGRVAAEFVMPYPPGIPAVVPGEELSREVLDHLAAVLAGAGRVVGPADATLGHLRVVAPPHPDAGPDTGPDTGPNPGPNGDPNPGRSTGASGRIGRVRPARSR